jgi:hypothetical protein
MTGYHKFGQSCTELLTLSFAGLAAGSVSTGLIHATPGLMKSFKSSTLSMADISLSGARGAAERGSCGPRLWWWFEQRLFAENICRAGKAPMWWCTEARW